MNGLKFIFVPNKRSKKATEFYDDIQELYNDVLQELLPVVETESEIDSAAHSFEWDTSNCEIACLMGGRIYKVEPDQEPERVYIHLIGPNGIGAFFGCEGGRAVCLDRYFTPEPEKTADLIRRANGL